jgi:hypothetical protein
MKRIPFTDFKVLRQWLLLLVPTLISASACLAQQPGNSGLPAASPDVKRVVNAISGEWSGHMTVSIPGIKPETFPWDVKCSSAALGFGAACALEGKASIGPIAESCLLAYDAERKEAHYMCVTSMGEVHDHQGQWVNDNTIEFVPYKAVMMGQPVVETVRLSFPDDRTLHTESIVTTPNGGAMTFTFTGERR